MPSSKPKSKPKGLTDQGLIEKYDTGEPINMGKLVRKFLNTPPLPKKKKKTL